jgi:hypothetical protein
MSRVARPRGVPQEAAVKAMRDIGEPARHGGRPRARNPSGRAAFGGSLRAGRAKIGSVAAMR